MKRFNIFEANRLSSAAIFACLIMLIGNPALQGIVLGAPASYVYPVVRPRISSTFGNRKHPIYKATRHHNGIDLAAPPGAPIRAIADGMVVFSDAYAKYGNLVVIQHDQGITSHYGHCKELRVQPGTRVKAGQIIATVGSTGGSTGPHLHLEIRSKGKPLDPERLIPGLTAKAQG